MPKGNKRKITITLDDDKELITIGCHNLSALELLGLAEALRTDALELMGDSKTIGKCTCWNQIKKIGSMEVSGFSSKKVKSGNYPVCCIYENGKPKSLLVELT